MATFRVQIACVPSSLSSCLSAVTEFTLCADCASLTDAQQQDVGPLRSLGASYRSL